VVLRWRLAPRHRLVEGLRLELDQLDRRLSA
jgi:hypothetical protein